MLIPPSTLDDLARSLTDAGGESFRFATAEVQLEPLDLVRSAEGLHANAVYFADQRGDEVAALGVAWRAVTAGSDRFSALQRELEEVPLPGAFRLLLGFAFTDEGPQHPAWSGFPAAELLLPQIAAVRSGDATQILVALSPGSRAEGLLNELGRLDPPGAPRLPDPGDYTLESRPHPAQWREEVAEAVAAIRSGMLEKVVLARSVSVRSNAPPRAFDIAMHLRDAYPLCFPFVWRRGDAAFFGASPELLLGIRGDQVVSNPLAGSAPRGEGEVEDRLLGEALLASRKDRVEHALVVEDIAARLEPHTSRIDVPHQPTLRRMAAVQHLSSEIVGRLGRGHSLFRLIEELHPTPAVGGTPRPEALAFIDKAEGIDRGWYSGGVGWVDGTGDAEIALALRCALARGEEARLYAGAGVVAESDPDEELVETRLKLRPMLELLAAT